MNTKIMEFELGEVDFKKAVVSRVMDEPKTSTEIFKEMKGYRVRKLFYPMCLFEGSYFGNWYGQEGHQEERLVVRSDDRSYLRRMFIDGLNGAEASRKQPDRLTSEVFTSWHRASGDISGGFSFYLPIREKNDDLMSGIQKMVSSIPKDKLDVHYMREVDVATCAADIEVIAPNVDTDYLWEMHAKKKVNNIINADLKQQMEGMLMRNLSHVTNKEYNCTLIYLPVWVFEFESEGKPYYLLMDECRKEVCGKLPYGRENSDIVTARSAAEATQGRMGVLVILALAVGVGLIIYAVKHNQLMTGCWSLPLLLFSGYYMLCQLPKMQQKMDSMQDKLSLSAAQKKKDAVELFGTDVAELAEEEERRLSQVAAPVSCPDMEQAMVSAPEGTAFPAENTEVVSVPSASVDLPPVPAFTPTSALPMQQMGTMGTKSRTVYILLAIFLGSFGVHNFYAGYVWRGMSQLLLTLLTFCLLAPVSFVWAIVEACVVKKDAQGIDFC